MTVVILYTIQGTYPIVGVAWRETADRLLLRVRYSDGETKTQLLAHTLGQLVAEAGIYSPRFAIEVPTLGTALDLMGLPVEVAEDFPAVHLSTGRPHALRAGEA